MAPKLAAFKTETPTNDALDEQILELLKKNPEGLSHPKLEEGLVGVNVDAIASAVNRLSNQHLKLFKQGNVLFYKLITSEDAKLKNLVPEELLVYQEIQKGGSRGVWTKDLRRKTNLTQPIVTKILKTLESRRLIKDVKNVNNPSRKLYMLYELEPSNEVTGGAWYTENQFDAEFIDVLREACYRYIVMEKDVTVNRVADFIRSRGFSKVDLRVEDIKTILYTLVCDGIVDVIDPDELDATGGGTGANDDDEEHYRPAALKGAKSTPLTDTPCGTCPVFDECRAGGLISPSTCVYFEKWLEF
uniref:DNA-directed RNA polymerase III subunit RPC6 n=1 Tax=Polytomella parva TaxID=51329 RepID=A0A7S0UN05_9CHLO|mmetsp:Transcript_11665/g.20982  ORF Transcript_11665/g.20982 Transcript_11665/m.20982 type:complete len:302 (+) Transcript_11665:64-969(+)